MTFYHSRGSAVNFEKLKPGDSVFLELSKRFGFKRFDGEMEFFEQGGSGNYDDSNLREWVTTEIEGLDTSLRNWTTSEIGNINNSLRSWVTTEINEADNNNRNWTTSEINEADNNNRNWTTSEINEADNNNRNWTTSEINEADNNNRNWTTLEINEADNNNRNWTTLKINEADNNNRNWTTTEINEADNNNRNWTTLEIQNTLIQISATPYLVGTPYPCFSKILGNDLITAKQGWMWLRGDLWTGGTIGNANSTATLPDDRLQYLFLEWGGSQEDWDTGEVIDFPEIKGRKISCAGQGSGLSNRAIGDRRGEETHLQTGEEVGPHVHTYSDWGYNWGSGWPPSFTPPGGRTGFRYPQTSLNTGGKPFNVMDPDIALPFLIFLGILAT